MGSWKIMDTRLPRTDSMSASRSAVSSVSLRWTVPASMLP